MSDPTQKLLEATPQELGEAAIAEARKQGRTLTERLDLLVLECVLESWEIVDVDENGVEGQEGKFRNSQKLYLTFPDGHRLEVGTFCSGCAENTCFV